MHTGKKSCLNHLNTAWKLTSWSSLEWIVPQSLSAYHGGCYHDTASERNTSNYSSGFGVEICPAEMLEPTSVESALKEFINNIRWI